MLPVLIETDVSSEGSEARVPPKRGHRPSKEMLGMEFSSPSRVSPIEITRQRVSTIEIEGVQKSEGLIQFADVCGE